MVLAGRPCVYDRCDVPALRVGHARGARWAATGAFSASGRRVQGVAIAVSPEPLWESREGLQRHGQVNAHGPYFRVASGPPRWVLVLYPLKKGLTP